MRSAAHGRSNSTGGERDRKLELAYVDRAGSVKNGDYERHYEFQVSMAVQAFSGAYWPSVSTALAKLKKATRPRSASWWP